MQMGKDSTAGGSSSSGSGGKPKAVDWRNTFINRARVWKAHAHEDAVELLALCAKWGAVPLLRRLLDDGRRSRHDNRSGGGDHGDAWVRDVINRRTRIGGKTVLHWACEYGNGRLVEHLVDAYGGWLDLNAKADIATVGLWPQAGGGGGGGGKTLHTPLSLASEGGHLDVLQFLLGQEGTRYSYLSLTLRSTQIY
jgi:ankyrin repeat protein